MKYKAILTFEYDIDQEVADLEEEINYFKEDPVQLAEFAQENGNYTVTVEEIK